MPKMALLLATDTWEKMDIFQRFLVNAPKALWRTRGKLTPEYLSQLSYPLGLYFFHRSIIKFRANCTCISRGNSQDWPLSMTPPEFRQDREPYSMFTEISQLERVEDTPIWKFPKWNDPQKSYTRGLQALVKVQDILASRV